MYMLKAILMKTNNFERQIDRVHVNRREVQSFSKVDEISAFPPFLVIFNLSQNQLFYAYILLCSVNQQFKMYRLIE